MTNIIRSLVSFQAVHCPKNLSTLIANASYHPITCEFSNSALSCKSFQPTTNSLTIVFVLFLHYLSNVSMYSFNLSHSPLYHSSQLFFSLLARKLKNALWKKTHNGKNYILPLSQAQGSSFIFHGDIL